MIAMDAPWFNSCKIMRIVTDTEAVNKVVIMIIIECKADIVKHSLISNPDHALWHVTP